MSPSPFDLSIFDLDGTLIDSRRDIAEALNHALARQGLPPLSVETVTGYVGAGARKLAERALQSPSDGRALAVARDFVDRYAEHLLVHTALYPGVAELLPRLPGKKALVSNKPHALTVEIVRRLGLDGLDPVLGPEAVRRRKPHPAAFLEVLRRTGLQADRTLVIGDSLYDLEAARAAKTRVCAVTWGFTPREVLEAARPDFLIDRFEELEPLLAGGR